MSQLAIRVENLGKEFRIGSRREKYQTFRDAVVSGVKAPFQRAHNLLRGDAYGAAGTHEQFWALRDISFEVQSGEVIGIIGHNGAGKSTLLKILSRITEPSTGVIDIYGRVGSLLEVGTGFHPELTGRENVYLNGVILGMRQEEVDAKFDEIVEFAGVEKFIDTPVKHYSSGMSLRLGFAVAAHLEPEILIVDEVLAVGDAAFQKKCLGKMKDVAQAGRTVLFVSHNMGAVQDLCDRAYLLKRGQLVYRGTPAETINFYLEDGANSWNQSEVIADDDAVRVNTITAVQGTQAEPYSTEEPLEIRVDYEVKLPIQNLLLGFDIITSDGMPLFRTYDETLLARGTLQPGHYTSVLTLPPDFFQGGTYYFEFLLGLHQRRWIKRGTPRLSVGFYKPRRSDVDYPGAVQSIGTWTHQMGSAEIEAELKSA